VVGWPSSSQRTLPNFLTKGKVEKFRIPPIFLQHMKTYYLNIATSNFFPHKCGDLGPFIYLFIFQKGFFMPFAPPPGFGCQDAKICTKNKKQDLQFLHPMFKLQKSITSSPTSDSNR